MNWQTTQDVSVASPRSTFQPSRHHVVVKNVTLLAIAALVGVSPLVWVILDPPGF